MRGPRSTPFEGMTALVTGGASGIGRAIGTELAARGAHVVLADVDGGAVERAASDAASQAGVRASVEGQSLDVRDEGAFGALVRGIEEGGREIDLLFNNAGISLGGPTHEMGGAHWDLAIDVNIRGVVNGVLAAYPGMVERGRGHIVNTASMAGLAAPPFVAPYAMTKHAVVGLSLGLRSEAALHGVKVSVLCPGAVETPILDRPPSPDLPPRASEPVTARMYLEAMRQRPAPAEQIARQALRGVARNQGIIVVPPLAKSLWYLHRLSPALTDGVGRLLARKVARDLIRPRGGGR